MSVSEFMKNQTPKWAKQMYRQIKNDPIDLNCRYLNQNHFKKYFSDKFGSYRVPYFSNISEFIDLLTIAKEYVTYSADNITYISTPFQKITALEDVLHLYDASGEVNAKPSEQEVNILYLPYWFGYLITAIVDGFENIEDFLKKDEGITKLKDKVNFVENGWKINYFNAFDRLSFYRTAWAIINATNKSNIQIDLTYGDVSNFIADYLELAPNNLEDDMMALLKLHYQWRNRFIRHYKGMYEKPLKLLEQDIYFLFEWLCSLSEEKDEAFYFDKWSQEHTRCDLGWSDLKKTIRYEDFDIKKTVNRLVPKYASSGLPKSITTDVFFDELSIHDSFKPWARSFYDLHKSITNDDICNYNQPRILDYLIVITIRTEIVIRSIFCSAYGEEFDDLNVIIKEISQRINVNVNEKKMLTHIGDHIKPLTSLRGSNHPENIFQKITECSAGSQWGRPLRCAFEQILKFITSRNYFAHHSYKDEEMKYKNSEMAREILQACVDSLLYFNHVIKQ